MQYRCNTGSVQTSNTQNTAKCHVTPAIFSRDFDARQNRRCDMALIVTALAETDRAVSLSQCAPKSQAGFRRGNYICQCATGFFMPASRASRHFDGRDVELQYSLMVTGQSNQVCHSVTGQLADTPTRGLPTRGLDNSPSRRCRQKNEN